MRLMIMKPTTLFLRLVLPLLCGSAIAEVNPRTAEELRYNDQPRTWDQQFTFKGQSRPGPYSKDPNVWVYTESFAKRFGMPQQWVAPNLNGIEAAAWRRVSNGNESCGWGGQEHACKLEYMCYLDIYIDEGKHPLPWATDRMVDWSEDFTSLRFLSSQNGERHRPLSKILEQHVRYGGVTKSPFADRENGREVFYFATANPTESQGSFKRMFGYERSAYPGLTLLVMLPLQCEFASDMPPIENIYKLEARNGSGVYAKVLKRFHEFVLPADFDRRVKEVLRLQKQPEREFNKQILNLK